MAKFCRKCGAALKGGKFCGACGAAVINETEVSKPKTETEAHELKAETKAHEPEMKREMSGSEMKTETKEKPQVSSHKKKGRNKKGIKSFIGAGIAAVVVLGVVFVVIGKLKGGNEKGLPVLGGSKEKFEDDAQAAYYYMFSNLIPFDKGVPYVKISNDSSVVEETMEETVSGYNDCYFVGTVYGSAYDYDTFTYAFEDPQGLKPYLQLDYIYQDILEDLYVVNGRNEKEMHMLDIMRCTPWGMDWGQFFSDDTVYDPEAELESLNTDTGLLWYLTFLNYSCEVETDETEDENGERWAHVTIHNTDMVKLLYEELEKTEQLVTEDRRETASEAITNSLGHMEDYFTNEAKNRRENQYVHVTAYPASGDIIVRPVYGDDMITKINVAAAVSGIALEGISYIQNELYWQNLTEDRTLFRYTLANMLERMENGDYDTVTTKLSFRITQDDEGNYYIPFNYKETLFVEQRYDTTDWDPSGIVQDENGNYRTNMMNFRRFKDSFRFADSDWGISDIARDKGVAGNNCSDSNATGGVFHSGGTAGDYGENIQNYQERIMYAIIGWRGTAYE